MKKIPFRNQLIKVPFLISIYFLIRKIIALPRFVKEYIQFRSQNDKRFTVGIKDLFPMLIDRTPLTNFEPHYIYHPAWAARIIAAKKPLKHIDIASTLHFSTVLSAFIPVEFYDYRPAKLNLSDLVSEHCDLTKLHFLDNSIDSLSCLHTIEHIGLGRYGDPIDPQGDIKAASELSRVLAPNGTFIFVTPVGKPRIEFNAHRIYSYEQVLSLFPTLKLVEFSLVPDDFKEKGLITNADPELVKQQNWGCGCFCFYKVVTFRSQKQLQ